MLRLLHSTELAALPIKQLQWPDQLFLHKPVLSVARICVTAESLVLLISSHLFHSR